MVKICCTILIIAVLLACNNTTQNDKPLLKFNSDTVNFGQIKKGDSISVTFPFHNVGKANLIIKDVQASCACTIVLFDKKTIAPGDSGVIKVQFNSSKTKDTGVVIRPIAVETNGIPIINVAVIRGIID